MMDIHTQQDNSMPTPPWTGTVALGLSKMDENMDTALVRHLRQVAYDPVTDRLNMPPALPSEALHGCGGARCSTDQEVTQESAVPA